MKKIILLIGIIGLMLINGLIWSYLKIDEVSFKKELARFESCLSIESDKCLQKIYDCESQNT